MLEQFATTTGAGQNHNKVEEKSKDIYEPPPYLFAPLIRVEIRGLIDKAKEELKQLEKERGDIDSATEEKLAANAGAQATKRSKSRIFNVSSIISSGRLGKARCPTCRRHGLVCFLFSVFRFSSGRSCSALCSSQTYIMNSRCRSLAPRSSASSGSVRAPMSDSKSRERQDERVSLGQSITRR